MRLTPLLTAGLLAVTLLSPLAHAQDVSLSFDFYSAPPVVVAPPALPVYVVPPPPADDLVWMPGHWRWDGYAYFWVPGTWVEAPEQGLLWTPGYWAWEEDRFFWHEGYWGPHVGYYGGIHYGGGYDGYGFHGGGWERGRYVVNRGVVNIVNIADVHNTVSFHGGPGGVRAAESADERRFDHERHEAPTRDQIAHAEAASHDRQLVATVNHGRPAIAATRRAGAFDAGVVAARSAGARNAQAAAHDAQVVRQTPEVEHNVMPPEAERTPQVQAPRPIGTATSHRHNTPYTYAPAAEPAREEPRPQAAQPQPAARAQHAPHEEARPQSEPAHGNGHEGGERRGEHEGGDHR